MTATAAASHEFWIEPLEFQVETQTNVEAHLRNGQNYKGSNQAYFDTRTSRFETMFQGKVAPVEGRLGDIPAFQGVSYETDGLLVIVHEATPSSLTYTKWEKFMTFAKHKDFANAEADHLAEGWSMERFKETYTRHSKALVAIGTGKGDDRAFGLETEFVALTNPYETSFNNEMRVLLNDGGAPRPDAQVEVFDRSPDGTVEITLHRTNDQGIATVPVIPGHNYLFDGVILRKAANAGKEGEPVWETLWAALTFAVPE